MHPPLIECIRSLDAAHATFLPSVGGAYLTHTIRYGEADHPGRVRPGTCFLKIAVVNPTSIASKAQHCRQFMQSHALQIMCMSETAALNKSRNFFREASAIMPRLFGHHLLEHSVSDKMAMTVSEGRLVALLFAQLLLSGHVEIQLRITGSHPLGSCIQSVRLVVVISNWSPCMGFSKTCRMLLP